MARESEAVSTLKQIVYVSAALVPFDEEQLTVLLARARVRNALAGITGMLLYRDGDFIQVLEGPPDVVDATFTRIGADPRHRRVQVLLQRELAQREFAEWSMGFRSVTNADVGALPGFSEFLDEGLDESARGRALKLLHVFRSSHR